MAIPNKQVKYNTNNTVITLKLLITTLIMRIAGIYI